MWSLYRPRSAAKPHRFKSKNIDGLNCQSPTINWPTFRLVHLLHRSGFMSEVWKSLSIKWSAGSIKGQQWLDFWYDFDFFAMISRLYIGSIGSLSKAFSQTTPVQHQTLWCWSDHRSCALVPSRLQISLKKIDFLQLPFLKFRHFSIFFWYLTSLSNRGASMLLQKALLLFDVRNLTRPGWTYLTVKTNWMFLDFLRCNYSQDLPHLSKSKSSESSDRPNSLWPSSPSKPIA